MAERGWFIASTAVVLLSVASAYVPAKAQDTERTATSEARNRLFTAVEMHGTEAARQLVEAIDDDCAIVRRTAAQLIAKLDTVPNDVLAQALNSPDVQVRHTILDVIVRTDRVDRHVKQLVTDEASSVRRKFHLHLLPEHFLADGEPTDALIEQFRATYRDSAEPIREEILATVVDLPVTEASADFLRRIADEEDAQRAAENDKQERGRTERRALMALRPLLEQTIETMRSFAEAGEWQQLVNEFADEDIAAWLDTDGRGRQVPGGFYASEPVEARYLLATAYYELGQGKEANEAIKKISSLFSCRHNLRWGFESSFVVIYHEAHRTLTGC